MACSKFTIAHWRPNWSWCSTCNLLLLICVGMISIKTDRSSKRMLDWSYLMYLSPAAFLVAWRKKASSPRSVEAAKFSKTASKHNRRFQVWSKKSLKRKQKWFSKSFARRCSRWAQKFSLRLWFYSRHACLAMQTSVATRTISQVIHSLLA